MQMITNELAHARELLAAAKDHDARERLTGVVLALDWAFEDAGKASPSEVAARVVAKPAPEPRASVAPPARHRG